MTPTISALRGGATLTAAALQGSTTRLLATVTSSVGGRSHHQRPAALLRFRNKRPDMRPPGGGPVEPKAPITIDPEVAAPAGANGG